MKTTSRLAIATAFAAFASTGVMAADLGGNCCSDLEERIAELEATTARKGNRKVSLEVSGHVNEAIVFWDVDSDDRSANESNMYIGTHNASRSRFRFKGSAKIDADWSAGFFMEFGVRAAHLAAMNQDSPNSGGQRIDIRHEALYLKSKRLGTVWLGWTSSAADGITEICLGCGLGNGPDQSDDMAGLRAFNAGFFGAGLNALTFGNMLSNSSAFSGEGDRREIIRYIAPEIAGFVVSAAVGPDDFYDVAIRYANEFNGVRVAAGIGYQNTKDGKASWGIAESSCSGGAAYSKAGFGVSTDKDCESLGMSASIQHVASGVYIAGAYGRSWDNTVPAVIAATFGDDEYAWHITGGVNRKFSPLGSTNIWAMYQQTHLDGGRGLPASATSVYIADREVTVYGVGVEQNIDAAALSLYAWWKHMDADFGGNNGLATFNAQSDQFVLGSRIRF